LISRNTAQNRHETGIKGIEIRVLFSEIVKKVHLVEFLPESGLKWAQYARKVLKL
jgi:hypothetical protein